MCGTHLGVDIQINGRESSQEINFYNVSQVYQEIPMAKEWYFLKMLLGHVDIHMQMSNSETYPIICE